MKKFLQLLPAIILLNLTAGCVFNQYFVSEVVPYTPENKSERMEHEKFFVLSYEGVGTEDELSPSPWDLAKICPKYFTDDKTLGIPVDVRVKKVDSVGSGYGFFTFLGFFISLGSGGFLPMQRTTTETYKVYFEYDVPGDEEVAIAANDTFTARHKQTSQLFILGWIFPWRLLARERGSDFRNDTIATKWRYSRISAESENIRQAVINAAAHSDLQQIKRYNFFRVRDGQLQFEQNK